MRCLEASLRRFPSLLHAGDENSGAATQRSMPSVLRLRTGVRIPPPPLPNAVQSTALELHPSRTVKPDRRESRRGHFVYIVRCADGTLYTGYARDPERRAHAHNAGRGASYTAGRRPVALVYSEAFTSVGDALKREHQVKRLSRASKERLIAARGREGS